ncbi:MAG: MBL fold metallo-hydrolase [Planctomycetes bacterium]|nr:MBL fold metallo-hydrolase [Planctomycetota bacterium]
MPDKISRRHFIESSSLALLFAAYPSWARAQERAAFSMADVRDGVGIFQAQGGTIAFTIDDAGLAVVDSQFEKTAKICLLELQKKAAEKPIEFLINTHHHGDHTGGNAVFRPVARKIVGHERVPELQRMQAKERKLPEPTAPDTTFAKSWSGKVGKREIRAKHYGPAHTGGDAVVTFVDANVAHMGDLVFNERHPFIDPPAGASIVNWPKVLDAAIADHDAKTKYIFGHGKGDVVLGGRKEVERFRDYLLKVVEVARMDIADGKSRDEIIARSALEGFDGFFVGNPERMSLASSLGVAFDELTRPAKPAD